VYLRCEGVRLKGPGGAAVNDPDDFLGKLKVDSCYLQMYKDTAEAKAPAVCWAFPTMAAHGITLLVDSQQASLCAVNAPHYFILGCAHTWSMAPVKKRASGPAQVCDYVERLLDMGVKFLVFGHHSVMLDSVEAVVSSKVGCGF
jgi:hypothetical protein